VRGSPHYHTAEEQLIIVKGNVSTGMEGMRDTVLGPGGFAMMPSKQPPWFTCTAKQERMLSLGTICLQIRPMS
jgi:quercetin dioxygenase-like cupin family protein